MRVIAFCLFFINTLVSGNATVSNNELNMKAASVLEEAQVEARRALKAKDFESVGQRILKAEAYTYFTPNVLTALMVFLVWILIFISGFCCLFQVQTPQGQFCEKSLQLQREF